MICFWQISQILYWVEAIYKLLSLPFLLLKIPLIIELFFHLTKTGYDRKGRLLRKQPRRIPYDADAADGGDAAQLGFKARQPPPARRTATAWASRSARARVPRKDRLASLRLASGKKHARTMARRRRIASRHHDERRAMLERWRDRLASFSR